MAGHWPIECLRHAGNLHPLRHAADPKQIDHDNVNRVLSHRLPMRLNAVEIFAGAYWRRQSIGDLGEPLVVVALSGVLEPGKTQFLNPPTDGNRLMHAPALIDVHHQGRVRTDSIADEANTFDFLRW